MVDYMQKAREAMHNAGDLPMFIRDHATTLEALDKAEAEIADANREVLSLIESIWRAEYSKDAPDWQPLPDLVGRITQLDNMYAGVRSQRDKAEDERDALQQFVAVFASDPCACGIAINKPCLPCKARTLIQPEPDPLAQVFDAIGIGPGIREDFRKELARHGLTITEKQG